MRQRTTPRALAFARVRGYVQGMKYVILLVFLGCGPPIAVPFTDAAPPEPDAQALGLVWTCLDGCGPPSPLSSKDLLIVGDETVMFTRHACLDCDPFVGVLGTQVAGCHAIHDLGWPDSDMRSATLCDGLTERRGQIEYFGRPGPIGRKVWAYAEEGQAL